MKRVFLLTTLLFLFHLTATAQTCRIAEMNTEQIRSLNLGKTVALLPRSIPQAIFGPSEKTRIG